MKITYAVMIMLIVLGASFYPAFIPVYKNRHDFVVNKIIANRLLDRVLASDGKKRDSDKIYRIQVMPDGRGVLNIYSKNKFKEGKHDT